MSKSTFRRSEKQGNDLDVMNFDSDARRSLCMRYGKSPDTFRLERLIDRCDGQMDVFNVLAADTSGGPVRKFGVLEVRTVAEMRRLQDMGV